MRNVPLPSAELPAFTRSLAACVAAILEIDPAEVPQPHPGAADRWRQLGSWLAARGQGLVPVADPAAFHWPGPWIALLASRAPEHAGLGGVGDAARVAAIAFGAPSAIVWNPLGGRETIDDLVAGYVIAPLDPALWTPRHTAWERSTGRVEGIAIAAAAEQPMVLVREAVAHAGRGLEGDRYFNDAGTFSNPNVRGTDLTLVEAETFEQLTLETGHLNFEQARRNVITRGIDLNALVGERFFVGEVECLGQRLCEPCAHLQRLTAPGVLRGLVHRGGLRADIVAGGTIRVGDDVRRG